MPKTKFQSSTEFMPDMKDSSFAVRHILTRTLTSIASSSASPDEVEDKIGNLPNKPSTGQNEMGNHQNKIMSVAATPFSCYPLN